MEDKDQPSAHGASRKDILDTVANKYERVQNQQTRVYPKKQWPQVVLPAVQQAGSRTPALRIYKFKVRSKRQALPTMAYPY